MIKNRIKWLALCLVLTGVSGAAPTVSNQSFYECVIRPKSTPEAEPYYKATVSNNSNTLGFITNYSAHYTDAGRKRQTFAFTYNDDITNKNTWFIQAYEGRCLSTSSGYAKVATCAGLQWWKLHSTSDGFYLIDYSGASDKSISLFLDGNGTTNAVRYRVGNYTTATTTDKEKYKFRISHCNSVAGAVSPAP